MRRRRWGTIALSMAVALVVAAGLVWWLRVPLLRLVPTPPVVITEQDDGRVVNLLQGQTLEVRLPANRFSGYRWHMGIPLSFLEQHGDVTFTEEPTPAQPGDGTQATSFLAVAPGTGPLFLSYLPDNNQNSYMPSKSFRVVVMVH